MSITTTLSDDLVEDFSNCGNCGVLLDLLNPRLACRATLCRDVIICTDCFARGAEFGCHQNDHPYAVLSGQLPLLTWDWTGLDELRLLDAIESCGFGNWTEIAKAVGGSKTPSQCRVHYSQHYTYGSLTMMNDRLKDRHENSVDGSNADSYLSTSRVACTTTLGRAPRPDPGSVEQSDEFAGYFPARGDFLDEVDPQAEAMVANISFDPADTSKLDDIDREAQLALVDGYRRRVLERERTKDIIARHGLLSRSQNSDWESRYFRDLGQPTVRSLLPLVNVLSPDDALAFFESLASTEQLKRRVCRLHSARSNGLKSLHEILQYERLNQLRQQCYSKPTACREVVRSSKDASALRRLLLRRHRDTVLKNVAGTGISPERLTRPAKKPPPTPLAIEHLQGFFKLTSEERDFCSNLRLFPSTYLSLKSQLVAECQRNDGLRLSRARTICSIDVNKTKRLYNFLLGQGLIHQ